MSRAEPLLKQVDGFIFLLILAFELLKCRLREEAQPDDPLGEGDVLFFQ